MEPGAIFGGRGGSTGVEGTSASSGPPYPASSRPSTRATSRDPPPAPSSRAIDARPTLTAKYCTSARRPPLLVEPGSLDPPQRSRRSPSLIVGWRPVARGGAPAVSDLPWAMHACPASPANPPPFLGHSLPTEAPDLGTVLQTRPAQGRRRHAGREWLSGGPLVASWLRRGSGKCPSPPGPLPPCWPLRIHLDRCRPLRKSPGQSAHGRGAV